MGGELPTAYKNTLALGQRLMDFPRAFDTISRPKTIYVHMGNRHDQLSAEYYLHILFKKITNL